jgi:hypothetical protein
MRALTVALVAVAGLMTVAAGTGASAAGPGAPAIQPPQAAALQQAQYYPRYLHHWGWGYPRYHHRHWWRGYDRWRYSRAEQLNGQELRRLGVAP